MFYKYKESLPTDVNYKAILAVQPLIRVGGWKDGKAVYGKTFLLALRTL